MFRNPWLWITLILIAAGIALTAALGALYWVFLFLALSVLILTIVFLIAAYVTGPADPDLDIPTLPVVSPDEQIPVIYDSDITLGCPLRDVSDGLGLLYLLGSPQVNLLAVTTTYGTAPVKLTTRATRRLLERLGHVALPVISGASAPDQPADENEAARYMVDCVNQAPGQVCIVTTGSLTNLHHAVHLDANFFKKVKHLYLMGGTRKRLVWNGHQLGEINFAIDPDAAYVVTHAPCPVTIVTGKAGLTVVFRGSQFAALLTLPTRIARFIARRIRIWFAINRLYFGDGGFAMWGSTPAIALTHPEIVESHPARILSTRDDFQKGQMIVKMNVLGSIEIVDQINDPDTFFNIHLAAWQRAAH